jgi:pyrroline-5-carboxylate reductase
LEVQRQALARQFGVAVHERAGAAQAGCQMVVWAVKPQSFAEAAAPCAAYVSGALQLSVMAGIRSDAIVAATGSERVVRAMPNTPALIGRGIAGLYARAAVAPRARGRRAAAGAHRPAAVGGARGRPGRGDRLSGSGPAYVFYVVEAMMQAAVDMGLSPNRAVAWRWPPWPGPRRWRGVREPPAVLRERVTSKGGTTHAAISSLEADGVKAAFVKALRAAQQRARELGGFALTQRQVHGDAGEHGEAQPVVEPEGLEAAFALRCGSACSATRLRPPAPMPSQEHDAQAVRAAEQRPDSQVGGIETHHRRPRRSGPA